MPHDLPQLVAVGPWETGEFAAIREEMDPARQWTTLESLEAMTAALAGSPPELALIALPLPDRTLQSQLDRLAAVAPLIRVVVVAGSWCEGELRTGFPSKGVVRLYWYEFAPWWRAAVARWQAGETPPWSEPLDDVHAGQQTQRAIKRSEDGNAPPASGSRRLAVDAVDFAVFETIAAAMAPWGWQCEWQSRDRPELWLDEDFDGAIWDGGQLSPAEAESLASLAERIHRRRPQAPVVALLDFPRVEHLQAVREAGAATLLGKPYQIAHLANELARLLAAPVETPAVR